MFVSAKGMLEKARAGRYAVGHFNINNLEWTRAILETAQEQRSPVILGVATKAASYMGGFRVAARMAEAMVGDLGITVPVALHLDHGSFEGAKECIRAGFSSVMYDGSHDSFEQNLENTRTLAAACSVLGLSLEAEVGSIGGVEDGVLGLGECADPGQCAQIASLGVTMLAAGIGNIHGKYPANWAGLDFGVLEAIAGSTGGVPLVLHGGSGIPEDMIRRAISMGVAKINVNTECMLAFQQEVRRYIEEGRDLVGGGYDPRALMADGVKAIKETVRQKMELFGSVGRA
ncbi:MAG: ketose-bisphosphate aldolase [Clostridia bacterium]|nr:ketose-bisphosphate aldolase [Clostridia bacterium]